MRILLSHPTGNEFARHAALALAEAGMLAEFHTCLAFPRRHPVWSVLPDFLARELRRRCVPDAVLPHVRLFPFRESMRLLLGRFGIRAGTAGEHPLFSVDAVYRSLDRRVAARLPRLPRLDAVYAYEDGALETFRAAKRLGIRCIYDLPIGYWRASKRILGEVARNSPEWAWSMPGLSDSAEKCARKDEELRLADLIIVASSFTKKTLAEAPFPPAPIHVIPYGSEALPPVSHIHRPVHIPIKALYVGSLSQRKGFGDLMQVMESFKERMALTVVGQTDQLERVQPYFDRLGVRYIPSLAHERLLALMREHDLLLFPSYFEGFGLVITEALSQGLPVITTTHTCAPDLLAKPFSDWIISPGDKKAMADILRHVLESPATLERMRRATTSQKLSTWADYRRTLLEILHEE